VLHTITGAGQELLEWRSRSDKFMTFELPNLPDDGLWPGLVVCEIDVVQAANAGWLCVGQGTCR
jgi:hypothetical protein